MTFRWLFSIQVLGCWRRALAANCDPVQFTQPMDNTSSRKALSADLFFQMVGFTSKTVKDVHINGHFAKVSNPAGRFSVSPPLPGGCGTLNYAGASGKLHTPQCVIAVNGGRYDVTSPEAKAGKHACYGNLVSDGNFIQASPYNTSNVNFGVKMDGSFVVGYIAPEEVKRGEYEQLIEGTGWLVHKGRNHVAQGWKQAYQGGVAGRATQPAGMSGRVGLGYSAKGELLVLVIDGSTSTPSWGATMYELADKMIELGAVEAINLDGGGSTQIWYKGVVVGYSSDRAARESVATSHDPKCPIGSGRDNLSAFQCLRKVSSFLCIHERNSESENPLAAAIVSDELFDHWLPVAITIALLAALLTLWLLSRREPGSEKEVLLVCEPSLEGGSGSAMCPGESSSDDSESVKSMA